MTQSTKFPDAEAIEAATFYLYGEKSPQDGLYFAERALESALNSYRNRTGIDLADVSEKLASGTHVLVPVEPTSKMCVEGHMAFEKGAGIVTHRAVTLEAWKAMIRAAGDKSPTK